MPTGKVNGGGNGGVVEMMCLFCGVDVGVLLWCSLVVYFLRVLQWCFDVVFVVYFLW